MLEDMMEKIETLKDMIGSRDGYLETTRMLQLDKKEKDIFMRASLEVNKSEPNFDIIDQAHTILVNKSFQEEDTADDRVLDESTSSKPVQHTATTPKGNTTHKFCTSCGDKLDTNAQFCSKCGIPIPKVVSHPSSNAGSRNTAKATKDNEHHIDKPRPSTPKYNSNSLY